MNITENKLKPLASNTRDGMATDPNNDDFFPGVHD